MKKKIKILIYIFLLIILLSLTTFTIYNNFFKPKPKLSPKIQKIIDDNKKNIKQPQTNLDSNENYISKINDYRAKYNNNNIQARLIIRSLNIDLLITRGNDNNFYLNHNIYNYYDELGTPFLDYRNLDIENDRQINIYGHNTENEKYYDQLPLVYLEAYTDEYFFKTNKEIILETEKNQKKYQVIAIKIIKNKNEEHMNLSYSNDTEWMNHMNRLLSNALYIDLNMLTETDKFLVLQICHYNPKGSYLLVIGKEISS